MGRLWWSWTMTAAQLTVGQFTSASISSVISIALTAIHVLDCTLAVHTRTISTLGPCCHRVFFTIKFHSNGGHQPKAPKRHEYATYLSQYFQCSKLHTSTQDTVYQSTVIPLEVCCSPTLMLIHSVLCIWCQTITCLNFTFTVTFSFAWHLGNTSIQANYLKTVFIC